MSVTQADIDALEALINGGTSNIRYADRQIAYQPLDQLRARLAEMKREFAARKGRSATTYARTRKGL